MIHLFSGHDAREAIGWHVFASSVLNQATQPVALHRLDACGLAQGSNAFTLSRFLVPYFMGYRGHAIFADGADMLMLGDVAALDALFDERYAVQVVKHDYRTRNPRKYVGTRMECDNLDYERKNWASLMLVNCAHWAWYGINPHWLQTATPLEMLQLGHVPDEVIGALPAAWNCIVDEGQPAEGAHLLHWTAGIPGLPHYANQPGADLWRAELDRVMTTP